MRVIGIDPGLITTGIGVIDKVGNSTRYQYHGTIKPPAKKTLPERLNYLFTKTMDTIGRFQPDVVAIEDTFHGKNIKTAVLLGQARGVLLLAGFQSQIPCIEYAPRKVKQSVVGNGGATKEQVQFMVKAILGLNELPTPIDASDALAIALCHLHQNQ